MATRNQKAATTKKAEGAAARPVKAARKPAASNSGKGPKPAGKSKAPAKAKAPAKGKAPGKGKPEGPAAEPAAKLSFGERFWHRLGLRAQASEKAAHEHEIERQERHARELAEENARLEKADAEARAEHRRQLERQRKADAKAAREMTRLAQEEDARIKRDAHEARLEAARQARAEKAEAERQAREDAERAAAEKAEKRRRDRQAKAEAAREARAEKAEAERQARQAAERAAAEKAEQRRLDRQVKADAKRRAEEDAQQQKVDRAARKRRKEPVVTVDLHEKVAHEDEEDAAIGEEVAIGDEVEVEGDAKADTPHHVAEVETSSAETGDEDDAPESAAEAVEEEAEPQPVKAPARKPAPAKAAKAPKAPVPAEPTSEVETQADKVAQALRSMRSKPIEITVDDEADAVPSLPVGRAGKKDESAEVLQLDPAPVARIDTAPRGLSIPEQFLLLTLDEDWDERRERARPGGLGGALTGALLLELVLAGKVRVQRDRFQLTDVEVDDAAAAVVRKLKEHEGKPSLQAMTQLAKWLPQLMPVYKDRMQRRGLLEHRAWRHLGLFYRSQTALLDQEGQERLRNKLGRAIAGGGRPDAPTILALGLLEASGQFGLVVPEGAQQYNRKRLNGLLAGKDVMGYKVDDELKGMQEIAVRTVLDNVRVMTVRG